jgi:ribosomal protein L21
MVDGKMRIKLIIITLMISLAFLSGCIRQSQNEGENEVTIVDNGNFINGSFPSKVGQNLTYEVSDGVYRYYEVTEKTTFENHDVLKIVYMTGENATAENIENFSQYMLVDSLGRIWKIMSGSSYWIYNYEELKYYNHKTDESQTMPSDYIHWQYIIFGTYWKQKNLSVGDTFTVKTGSDSGEKIEYQDVLLTVNPIEEINVTAGEFQTYKIIAEIDDDGKSASVYYWVDIETGTLIKWETSPDNGDELYQYSL